MNGKPKVICYYEPLKCGFSKDSFKLIDLWKKSWSKNGWDTTVLNRSDAESHPSFEKLDIANFKNNLYLDDANKPYSISCYSRLIAYSNYVLKYGPVFFADYDVMNYSFTADKYYIYEDNTVLGCGTCVAKLNEIGAQSIINAISDRAENYDKDISNAMVCFIRKAKGFKYINKYMTNWAPNDIRTEYDECKTSEFVHYHGGWRNLTQKQLLNTNCRSDFVKSFRPI